MSKIVLITGATSGFGEATAERFAKAGYKVIVTGRRKERLEALKAKLPTCDILPLSFDVTQKEEVFAAIASLPNEYKNIDILVNNAGILTQNDFNMNYLDISLDEWDSVINVNLKAVFFMCQNMAKHMLKNSVRGHIVNIASEMGLRPACVTYGISKWGVIGMTKGLGKMLANRGIVVNGIAPGAITTEMMNWHEGDSIYRESHANKRFGFPDEIANLAAFLCSGLGDNIIGEIITSDGGSSLH